MCMPGQVASSMGELAVKELSALSERYKMESSQPMLPMLSCTIDCRKLDFFFLFFA